VTRKTVDKPLVALASSALLAWALWVGALVAQSTVTVNPRITGNQGGGSATVGSGGATALNCGTVTGATLTTTSTSVQTGANTTETDLWTYTVPAGTLNADGRGFRVHVDGTTAANANNKTVRFYIGASNSASVLGGAPNGIAWWADVHITRNADSGQRTMLTTFSSAATFTFNTNTTTPGSWSSPVQLKVTGQNGTASAGDIVLRTVIVECF
jgi:hypothetical protein